MFGQVLLLITVVCAIGLYIFQNWSKEEYAVRLFNGTYDYVIGEYTTYLHQLCLLLLIDNMWYIIISQLSIYRFVLL